MKRCCELCPELGRPEDLQIISKNIGLRRKCPHTCRHTYEKKMAESTTNANALASRKGGPRIELEKGKWNVPVVHAYGHSGFGYQSSW